MSFGLVATGRDHEDAGVGIDFRCRDRGTRALVAKDRDHSVGDQLVRGGDGLLAIAIVVGRDQLDLLAEHAALWR